MKPTRIVILGGGYAGIIAARRLAYKTHGQPVTITLVNAADHFVERIRHHQLAANQPLPKHPMSRMLKGTNVHFTQGWVKHIAPGAQSLTIETADATQSLSYDYLIYALGSFVDTSRVPGVAEYALTVSEETSAMKLRQKLLDIAPNGGHVVVCGGGLSGIETASELAEAYPGLRVSLLTRDHFGDQLSQRGQAYLRQAFNRLGITVTDQTNISRITATQVEYQGGSLAYDVCIWTGSFTVPALAREAGLAVNSLGQIITDSHTRSISHPTVYAVGDAADVSAAIQTPIRMACATAYAMASYAADDLAARLQGNIHRAYDFGYTIRCISLGRHDGLVQIVDADDRPKERIVTGWLGAQIKEFICRSALWQITHAQLMVYPRAPHSKRAAMPKTLVEASQ
jgi:NADH dehydrogenase